MCETSSISRLYFLTFSSLSTREQHNFKIKGTFEACNGARGLSLQLFERMGKEIQIPRDKLHFTIFTHAQKFLQRNQTFPQTYLILILCTPSLGERIFFLVPTSSFHSSPFFFFLKLGSTNFPFFSQPLFPFPDCIYNLHSPLITTPILTIMKCQLSQDQGSSWFFGLKGLSPMRGSKENYHGFSL